MVNDGGGQDQSAAHGKVGEVAHEGGAGALEQELDHDLDEFADHARHGAEAEAAEQHRQLAQIDLIEAGGEENGDLQQHEDARQGGAHGAHGDVLGVSGAHEVFADGFLRQPGQDGKSGKNGGDGQYEGQVFFQDLHGFTSKKVRLRAFRRTCRKKSYLLPSRLYCRYRNHTGSCAEALADFTAGREFHPALKINMRLPIV